MSYPTPSDVDPSFGCALIGITLATLLYGVLCAQIAYYFKVYPKDPLALKILIMMLWCIDTSRMIATIALTWFMGVQGHGNILSVSMYPTTYYGAQLALSALAILIVQSYYVYQTWRFFNRRWYKVPLTVTMAMLALTCFASGIAAERYLTASSDVSNAIWASRVPALLQPLFNLLTDLYNTVMLSWMLNKNKTVFKTTNNTITRLVTFAITRGLCTAFTQLMQVILYWLDMQTFPPQLYWIIFYFSDSEVYTNSLLALLNQRQ